jgi:hypothetical protein
MNISRILVNILDYLPIIKHVIDELPVANFKIEIYITPIGVTNKYEGRYWVKYA